MVWQGDCCRVDAWRSKFTIHMEINAEPTVHIARDKNNLNSFCLIELCLFQVIWDNLCEALEWWACLSKLATEFGDEKWTISKSQFSLHLNGQVALCILFLRRCRIVKRKGVRIYEFHGEFESEIEVVRFFCSSSITITIS